MQPETLKNSDEKYFVDDMTQIPSPGLIIFREILEANLAEMVRIAGGPHRLCPHCKTHKTREITQILLNLGVTHHKCATIAEAEMLASVGVSDVLIAYQMVGPNVDRLFKLIDQFPQTRFTTLIDHPDGLNTLQQAPATTPLRSVLIDLDSGMRRTGIELGPPAMELIEMTAATEGIRFVGLHWYDGHQRQADRTLRQGNVMAGWQQFQSFCDHVMMDGITIERIVTAGTGSFPILAEVHDPRLQLSPGTTVFFDADMEERFPELALTSALAILTRVVSVNRTGFLTIDVGHKACAADQPAGNRLRFPNIPDAREAAQTEEHCVIATKRSSEFRLGDPIIAIPRHACPTSAVHQMAHIVSNGQVVDRWSIAARNRVLSI